MIWDSYVHMLDACHRKRIEHMNAAATHKHSHLNYGWSGASTAACLPFVSTLAWFSVSLRHISCFFNIRDSSCLKIQWSAVGSASWVIRKTRHDFLEGLLNAKEGRTLTHPEAEEVPLLLYSSPTGPGVDSVLVHPLRYESRCLFRGQSLH